MVLLLLLLLLLLLPEVRKRWKNLLGKELRVNRFESDELPFLLKEKELNRKRWLRGDDIMLVIFESVLQKSCTMPESGLALHFGALVRILKLKSSDALEDCDDATFDSDSLRRLKLRLKMKDEGEEMIR